MHGRVPSAIVRVHMAETVGEVTTGAETGMVQPPGKECEQLPEGKSQILPWSLQRACGADDILSWAYRSCF